MSMPISHGTITNKEKGRQDYFTSLIQPEPQNKKAAFAAFLLTQLVNHYFKCTCRQSSNSN